jgi:molybdopterin converting factor small subunit
LGEIALVTVEFFGIPRQRAGRAELHVRAGTVGETLAAVEQVCPALAGVSRPDGRVSPHYLLSVNGERFLTDLAYRLQPGDHLLLLSADSGG